VSYILDPSGVISRSSSYFKIKLPKIVDNT
jgi:hypothetical protein